MSKHKDLQRFDLIDSDRGFIDRLLNFFTDYKDYDITYEDVVRCAKSHKPHLRAIGEGLNHFTNLVTAATAEFDEKEIEPIKYLKPFELAKILNVSKGCVSQWQKKGLLPSDIRYSDVDKLVTIYTKYNNAWSNYKLAR